jgi:hypothetical protein
MQVSSVLRAEASKLFWANPKAYFLISADWLIDGADSAYTYCDLSFLPYIQNVLIDYHMGIESKICPMHDQTMVVRPERIAAFWKNLIKRCPNVKRVVIDQNWLSHSWRKESQRVPRAARILIHSSPSYIQTSAFIVEETENSPTAHSASTPSDPVYQRSLYRPSAGGGVWAPVKVARPWKVILPPAKQFNGPVGKYEKLDYDSTLTLLQRNGLWSLMVEALDRHHFDMGNTKPFLCPSSNCDAFFQKAGEWSVHAAKSHYNDWVTGDRFRILPKELKVEFEEFEKAVDRKGDEIRRISNDIRDNWKQGGRKQREIERGWMEQLENDVAWNTGTTPNESRLWRNFVREMEQDDFGYRQ